MTLGGGEEDLGGNNGSREELTASSFIVSLSIYVYMCVYICVVLYLSLSLKR